MLCLCCRIVLDDTSWRFRGGRFSDICRGGGATLPRTAMSRKTFSLEQSMTHPRVTELRRRIISEKDFGKVRLMVRELTKLLIEQNRGLKLGSPRASRAHKRCESATQLTG